MYLLAYCINLFFVFQAYYILDEILIGGELQETNKKEVLRVTAAQDELMSTEDDPLRKK